MENKDNPRLSEGELSDYDSDTIIAECNALIAELDADLPDDKADDNITLPDKAEADNGSEDNNEESNAADTVQSGETALVLESAAQKLKRFLEFLPLDYIFAALCAGFCFGSFMTLMTTDVKYTDISFVSAVSLQVLLGSTVVFFALVILISVILKSKRIVPFSLLASAVLFGSTLAYKGCVIGDENASNIYMNIAIGFVMFFITAWICRDDKLGAAGIILPKHTLKITAAAGIVFFHRDCISRLHSKIQRIYVAQL